ncbi:MAG: SDR family oxidoreductase [Chloroflexi bacterium]|nr:SDR family oxidoreductase [Chloroflexota bacterium]
MPNPIAQLFDLKGKSAIVTGGALGIGQAIALRLAEAGAAITIADVNLNAANATVEQIKVQGGKVQAVQADAASVADAKRVVEMTLSAFGSIDILVNNAGIFPFSPATQTTEELWDKVLDVNLKGAFFYSQAVAQKMIDAGRGGKIIMIASIDSLHPTGNLAHYDASKGGMLMLTKSLAVEFGRYNINVNAIAPGGIQTPGGESQAATILKATGMTPEQMVKGFVSRIPLGRMGAPDDIAKAVLFLASAAADYMTGSLMVVDGGYLLS